MSRPQLVYKINKKTEHFCGEEKNNDKMAASKKLEVECVLEPPVLEELGLVACHVRALQAAGLWVDGAYMAEDAALVHAAPAVLAALAQSACKQTSQFGHIMDQIWQILHSTIPMHSRILSCCYNSTSK